MQGDKTKNQHYVPQSYLRYFATSESRAKKPDDHDKWRIHMYKKEEGKLLRNQLIADVASQNWFYDLPDDPDQEIENYLEGIETRAGTILKMLAESGTANSLGSSDLFHLAQFIATLHLRTQKYRARGKDVIETLLSAQAELPEVFAEFTKRNAAKDAALFESRFGPLRQDVETRRLEIAGLPQDQQEQLIPELERRQRVLEAGEQAASRLMALAAEGKVPPEYVDQLRQWMEAPAIMHSQAIRTAAPKFAQRLLEFDWSVFRYSKHCTRLTSDSPLIVVPLADPAFEDDYKAHLVYVDAWLGRIPVLREDLIDEYPPLAFVLPLTSHLDLIVAPYEWMLPLSKEIERPLAYEHNLFQIVQANRFLFSHTEDFLMVSKELDIYYDMRQRADNTLPELVRNATSKYDNLPYSKRWRRYKLG